MKFLPRLGSGKGTGLGHKIPDWRPRERRVRGSRMSLSVTLFLSIATAAMGCKRETDSALGKPHVQGLPASSEAPAVPEGEPDSSSTVRSITQTKESLSPFTDVPKTRERMPLEGDPFGADSHEDQRWLDRNGYPNAEQWRVYSDAEEGLLRLAAESGDEVAQVFLDARLLSQGDKEAVDRLFFAAERGSAFALSMLQAYMIGSSNGDPELGYAISRVMEMKGDTRIALVRDMSFATPLTGERRMRAEALALQLYEQLRRNAKHHPFVDPRPLPTQPQ